MARPWIEFVQSQCLPWRAAPFSDVRPGAECKVLSADTATNALPAAMSTRCVSHVLGTMRAESVLARSVASLIKRTSRDSRARWRDASRPMRMIFAGAVTVKPSARLGGRDSQAAPPPAALSAGEPGQPRVASQPQRVAQPRPPRWRQVR